MRELFLVRERPRVLVVWADPAPGPVFAESDSGFRPSRAERPPRRVGAVPVETVGQRELTALFRANPDGWEAFYARYPGALGIIEFAPAQVDDDSASLVVGRSCGEHCRFVWRVQLRRVAAAQWRVARVTAVERLR